MKPLSIKRFEQLFIASAVITVLATMLNYGVLRSQAIAQGSAAASPIAGVVFELLVSLALWYAIVRRASNVAKWILVVLVTLGAISLPWTYEEVFLVSRSYSLLSIVAFVLSLASTALLFTQESIVWLKSKGTVLPVSADIFS
jgi:hypothetical protein